jgi:hypothetical protein
MFGIFIVFRQTRATHGPASSYTKGRVWNPTASSKNPTCWCKLWCYADAIAINAASSHSSMTWWLLICVDIDCSLLFSTISILFHVLAYESFKYMHWPNSSMHLILATTHFHLIHWPIHLFPSTILNLSSSHTTQKPLSLSLSVAPSPSHFARLSPS